MQPMRDLDVIRIIELHTHLIKKLDVDIETIGDFNIDQAQFTGFQEAARLLNELTDSMKFLPLSRSTVTTV
jgi:hypothetical protein